MINPNQVYDQGMGRCDPHLVQHGYLDAVPDLCPCWLATGALEFVPLREARGHDINKEVYSCRDDESDNLAKDNDSHFNLAWFVLGTNVGPNVLKFFNSNHVWIGFSDLKFN